MNILKHNQGFVWSEGQADNGARMGGIMERQKERELVRSQEQFR